MGNPLDAEKDRAARAAVDRLRPGLKVALGTGSTAACAVRAIAERFPGGGGLSFVASSSATEELANVMGLHVRPLSEGDRFDLMLDGADEVTPQLDLTKGGGGALFREKLLARLSAELLIMVDHTKLVRRLGERAPIPVEVVPFARPYLSIELAGRGHGVTLRMAKDGRRPFITDNGNEILDLTLTEPLTDPAQCAAELKSITGVVETGIFPGMAHTVLVGRQGGGVDEIRRG